VQLVFIDIAGLVGAAVADRLGEDRKNADIEILRAVAVMITMIGHSPLFFAPDLLWLWAALNHWWGGVDLFFVISGYVILRSMHIDTEPWSMSRAIPFWTRRFFRIQPLAFSWFALGLLCTLYLNQHGSFGVLPLNITDAEFAALQSYNFYVLWEAVHNRGAGIFAHYWSLSMEEQFYLIIPFLLLIPRRPLAAIISVAVLAQLFIVRLTNNPFNVLRTETLLLGILLALLRNHPIYLRLEPRAGWPILVLGALSIPAIPALASFIPFSSAALAVVCTALVFVASFDRDALLPAGRLRRAVLYVGSRSYGLYLAHPFCYRAAIEIFKGIGLSGLEWRPAFAVLGVVLTFAMTELLYRFVEWPLREYGRMLHHHKAGAAGREKLPVTRSSVKNV
jgi:peptidoglycan/LPS O-acetylase OafA/YrhL